jgi:NAD(P)-dependent dehydrogenase (short-subunit alcohol dehydrogenase family)
MQGVRSVIVTGSNKGIGFAVSENLAGKGWKVIMAVRNEAYG